MNKNSAAKIDAAAAMTKEQEECDRFDCKLIGSFRFEFFQISGEAISTKEGVLQKLQKTCQANTRSLQEN